MSSSVLKRPHLSAAAVALGRFDAKGASHAPASPEPPAAPAPAPDPLPTIRARAEAIVAEAERQAERVRAQAFADGYEAGRAAGEAEVRAQLAALERLTAAWEEAYERALEDLAEQALALGLALARRIFGQAVAGGEGLAAAVHEALRRMGSGPPFEVRLSPADAARVGPFLADAPVRVRPDPELGPGEMFVASAQEQVEASPAAQLELLEEAARQAWQAAGGGAYART